VPAEVSALLTSRHIPEANDSFSAGRDYRPSVGRECHSVDRPRAAPELRALTLIGDVPQPHDAIGTTADHERAIA
jgi:hypothetical protein